MIAPMRLETFSTSCFAHHWSSPLAIRSTWPVMQTAYDSWVEAYGVDAKTV
jgi:hypothetical protein